MTNRGTALRVLKELITKEWQVILCHELMKERAQTSRTVPLRASACCHMFSIISHVLSHLSKYSSFLVIVSAVYARLLVFMCV